RVVALRDADRRAAGERVHGLDGPVGEGRGGLPRRLWLRRRDDDPVIDLERGRVCGGGRGGEGVGPDTRAIQWDELTCFLWCGALACPNHTTMVPAALRPSTFIGATRPPPATPGPPRPR